MGYKISAALMIVIFALCGVGYWYYTDTQKTIAVLTENNAKLETAVQLNEDTISSLQADYQNIVEENNRINQAYTEIRRQNERLNEKLADVDLGLIAAEKPGAIERAINRGTENAGRCFEILSGAELTETERNATNGERFNKECPWLWPGNAVDSMQ